VVVVARARGEKSIEAERLYRDGVKLVDISRLVGVPQGTVRRWKYDQNWDIKKSDTPKKQPRRSETQSERFLAQTERSQTERSDSKPNAGEGNARKKGAPRGNKNALGHGAPPGNKNNFKHGLYEKISMDTLDDQEIQMTEAMPFDEEYLLCEQLRLFSVRERRLMKRIEEHRDKPGGLALESVVSRKLEIKGNVVYDDKQTQTETTTRTISTFDVIQKLESELTRVQRQKTHCVEALNRLRNERRKLDDESRGNAVADDWIKALTGGVEPEVGGDDE
jgi:uncharacterized protein YjcR